MLLFAILMTLVPMAQAAPPSNGLAAGPGPISPEAAQAVSKIPGLEPHEKFPCGMLVHIRAGTSYNNKAENLSQGIFAKAIRIASLTENSEEGITYIVNVTGTNDQSTKIAVVLNKEEDKVRQCMRDYTLKLGQNSVQPGETAPTSYQKDFKSDAIANPAATGSEDRKPAAIDSGH